MLSGENVSVVEGEGVERKCAEREKAEKENGKRKEERVKKENGKKREGLAGLTSSIGIRKFPLVHLHIRCLNWARFSTLI